MGDALSAQRQKLRATHFSNIHKLSCAKMQSTKPMIMDQHQSVFFRLPRELRDEVYYYYVWEDQGYSHRTTSETLRATNGDAVRISLQYTCKRVAKEMDGVAFRTNKIIFRTIRDSSDVGEQPSNAWLYEELLEDRGSRLRHMLLYAYSVVSTDVMQELGSRYPSSPSIQRMVDMISTNGNTGLRSGYLPKVETLDTYNDESMLQDLVEIMSTQADFAHLSSKEYDLELREATKIEETDEDYFSDDSDDSPVPPCYTPETQMDVLRWRPRLWWIHDRNDLKSVLEFLYIWPTAPPDPPVDDAWIPRMYFSAAAVATRFLEGLSPHVCKHLRKIIITEDRLSVASPIAHGQAFIPFCIANPSLRVERRVDIWYTEFVHRSEFFREDTSGTIAWIATWINEVKILYQKGMPIGCFSLVLHGPSDRASQQLSDAVIRAAIWQDGAMEIARREQRQFDDDDGVAEDFVDVIKEMLRGEIPARFDADMGELWDIEKLLRENDGDWPTDVRDVFRLQDFDEPDGGWEAAREVYTEDVAWMDRVNGWRRLAGEEPL